MSGKTFLGLPDRCKIRSIDGEEYILDNQACTLTRAGSQGESPVVISDTDALCRILSESRVVEDLSNLSK
jgi:hypothetical protein